MRYRPERWTAITVLAALLAAGCTVAPERSYPIKRQYVLQARRNAAPAAKALPDALRVRLFRAASPFSGTQLVYRRDDVTFETDFYNEFLAPPAGMITSQTERWLAAAGIVANVVNASSRAATRYTLEGNVTALHGDYTQPTSPAAVMEVQLAVLDNAGADTAVVFHKTYRKAVPLKSDAPPDLVRGLNACLAGILSELESDLQQSLR